jgi:hypothetical protein
MVSHEKKRKKPWEVGLRSEGYEMTSKAAVMTRKTINFQSIFISKYRLLVL